MIYPWFIKDEWIDFVGLELTDHLDPEVPQECRVREDNQADQVALEAQAQLDRVESLVSQERLEQMDRYVFFLREEFQSNRDRFHSNRNQYR